MILTHLMMLALMYVTGMRLWMNRIYNAALRQIRAMPHRTMIEYMRFVFCKRNFYDKNIECRSGRNEKQSSFISFEFLVAGKWCLILLIFGNKLWFSVCFYNLILYFSVHGKSPFELDPNPALFGQDLPDKKQL